MQNTKLTAALALAKQGHKVFPLVPDGKTPLLPENWRKIACNNPEQIKTWWSASPQSNIGMVMEDLVALDIDPRNGGVPSYEALLMLYEMPHTRRHITWSQGEHILYRQPAGVQIGCSQGRLGPGIDVKGLGGYLVAPGSTIKGKPYLVANPDREITELPPDLVALCGRARVKSESAGKRLVDEDEIAIQLAEQWLKDAPEAVEGQRDDTAFLVAAKLYDFGVSRDTCREMLAEWSYAKCFPSMDPEDIERVARSGETNRAKAIGCSHPLAPGFEPVEINEEPHRKKSQDEAPGGVDEWDDPVNFWADIGEPPAVPSGVVPDIIERYAHDRGKRFGVEPGAVAATTAAALGSLVPAGNDVQMRQLDPHWRVKAITWVALIGNPGSNKSATVQAAVAPVRHVEGKWRRQYGDDVRVHEQAKAAAKSKGEAKALDDAPKPVFRRKIVNDVTIEALQHTLSENPDGLLYLNDELSSLFGGMDAYSARKGKDRPFWLQAKEGGPYATDRRTTGHTMIENCAVSVLGGIQPDKIRGLMADLSSDGMLQRFLPVFIRRTGPGVDMLPDEDLDSTMIDLAQAVTEEMPRNGTYKFAPEAADELATIEAFKVRECEQLSGPICHWLDKLPNEFGRWSLIFHVVEWYSEPCNVLLSDPLPELISRETAQRARRFLIEFGYPHARAFYSRTTAFDEHAVWISGFILSRNTTTISARDIYRSYPALKNRRELIPIAMQRLTNAAWARATRWSGYEKPTAWEINPMVHDGRFAEVAERERERRETAREQAAGG